MVARSKDLLFFSDVDAFVLAVLSVDLLPHGDASSPASGDTDLIVCVEEDKEGALLAHPSLVRWQVKPKGQRTQLEVQAVEIKVKDPVVRDLEVPREDHRNQPENENPVLNPHRLHAPVLNRRDGEVGPAVALHFVQTLRVGLDQVRLAHSEHELPEVSFLVALHLGGPVSRVGERSHELLGLVRLDLVDLDEALEELAPVHTLEHSAARRDLLDHSDRVQSLEDN
mmetsp:Transcript_11962/g.30993  ORF Transcript_11962/g.30993 Transcript_11962/m.30993 type:complete len:226 (+) Transcript_11962:183-860(+)